MVTTLLALSLAAAKAPTVALGSLLETKFNLNGAEPSVMPNKVQIANAPQGDFKFQLVVRAGDQTLGETMPGTIYHAEDMAAVQLRVKSIPLGTSPGKRSIEVLVDGISAGKMDFELQKSGTEWSIDGPWKDHGQMRWNPSSGSHRVRFEYWVAGYELPQPKQPFKVVFKRGSKVLAQGLDKYPSGVIWTKRTDNLRKPDGKFVTTESIASLGEGAFEAVIMQDDKAVKTYRGSITGGKFALHSRSSENPPAGSLYLPSRDVGSAMNKLTEDIIAWMTP